MKINRQDLYFMQMAISMAEEAFMNQEIPIGAILTRGEEIIGKGMNRRQIDRSPIAHAEILALTDGAQHIANWRFDHCCLYVTLEPCAMCAGAIVQSRVARVVYGARDHRAGAGGSMYNILDDPRASHRCKVVGKVFEQECLELLRRYFLKRRAERSYSKIC